MKIELKNITHNKRLSRETSAYAAVIYVDGVKQGTVMNDGGGGPDLILPPQLRDQINKYAETLPPVKALGTTLPMSAEMIFSDLLENHLAKKDLERLMKTKTVFTVADGKIYTQKGTVSPPDAVKILNRMPIDEAVKLFMEKAYK